MFQSNPSLFLFPMEKRFDGSNWTAFKTMIIKATHGHGLLGYLTRKITDPAMSDSKAPISTATMTWWGATNPTADK